jgi:hypothetical protein
LWLSSIQRPKQTHICLANWNGHRRKSPEKCVEWDSWETLEYFVEMCIVCVLNYFAKKNKKSILPINSTLTFFLLLSVLQPSSGSPQTEDPLVGECNIVI